MSRPIQMYRDLVWRYSPDIQEDTAAKKYNKTKTDTILSANVSLDLSQDQNAALGKLSYEVA